MAKSFRYTQDNDKAVQHKNKQNKLTMRSIERKAKQQQQYTSYKADKE